MYPPDRPFTPTSTALVMIEFQREWLAPDGKLQAVVEDRSQFDAAVAAARTLLATARENGLAIAHAGLRFQEGYPELGSGGFGLRKAIRTFRTFPASSPASDFADGFEPRENEFLVQGRAGSSAFAGSNLDIWLRNNRIDTVILAGFALHVCVESTLRAAHDLGYEAYVAEDATAAFTSPQRRHVLTHVVPHFGQAVTNTNLVPMLENRLEAAQ
ncbi:cysteine hydrolase [Roseibium sp. Sym1]|uniref:cysteine hydrolase n=1 Tax=Roseibium sp. Sym1 TaxID=3016006 RepID=UPI0022B4AFB2|nr:cysteine hydrolase [Roseibium sp. Sym1]